MSICQIEPNFILCDSCKDPVYNSMWCTGCSTLTEKLCYECCVCTRCPKCVEVLNKESDLCNNCDLCTECCNGHLGTPSFFTSPLVFYSANRIQRKVNKSTRYVSAEIEIAGLSNDSNTDKLENIVQEWRGSIVKDNSLPEKGFEINTAPANGDLFINQIIEICNELKVLEGFINNSCGLHIHLDARDFSAYDIQRLIRLYYLIENSIFLLVPKTRRMSTHCRPTGYELISALGNRPKYRFRDLTTKKKNKDYQKIRNEIALALYGTNHTKTYKATKYNENRYKALNLHSWYHRGTIEIRLFGGTLDPNKILPWSLMWSSILDWVETHTDDDLMKLISNTSMDNRIFEVTSPEWHDWMYKRMKRFSK